MNEIVFDLAVNFLGYWFIGTGSEKGAYADNLTIREHDGFPYVPGKSLKGVFREAFHTAAENGWFDKYNKTDDARADFAQNLVNLFFGMSGTTVPSANGDNKNTAFTESIVHFSNARLPSSVKECIKDSRDHLFTTLQNTAIDKETGTAKNRSLRSIEVALPLKLHAELAINTDVFNSGNCLLTLAEAQELIENYFDKVCALITEIGGKRHRGLGRCYWKLTLN